MSGTRTLDERFFSDLPPPSSAEADMRRAVLVLSVWSALKESRDCSDCDPNVLEAKVAQDAPILLGGRPDFFDQFGHSRVGRPKHHCNLSCYLVASALAEDLTEAEIVLAFDAIESEMHCSFLHRAINSTRRIIAEASTFFYRNATKIPTAPDRRRDGGILPAARGEDRGFPGSGGAAMSFREIFHASQERYRQREAHILAEFTHELTVGGTFEARKIMPKLAERFGRGSFWFASGSAGGWAIWFKDRADRDLVALMGLENL